MQMVNQVDCGRQRPVVAVYGAYWLSNFGDDLMGVLIAMQIAALGFRPRLYKLARRHSVAFGIESVDNHDALLDGASAVVYGGGGLLVSRKSAGADELQAFADVCEQRRIALLAISVGGDGAASPDDLPAYRRRFLDIIRFATVRNREDLRLMESAGIQAEYYPDILFQTPSYFPRSSAQPPRWNIGVNLSGHPAYMVRNHIVRMLVLSRLGAIKNVAFYQTRLGSREWLPACGSLVRYGDLSEYVTAISETGVILSSKLHLGVTSLAYGNGFASLGGEKKTTLALKALRPSCAINFGQVIGEVPSSIRSGCPVFALSAEQLSQARTESEGHITTLSKLLGKYA